jgi:hypothetical protein
MTIAMGGNFMSLAMDHSDYLRCSLYHIPKNEEGGFYFKPIEKVEDLLNIDQDSTFTLIPARGRKDRFDITDMIPILHIHRQNVFHNYSISINEPIATEDFLSSQNSKPQIPNIKFKFHNPHSEIRLKSSPF